MICGIEIHQRLSGRKLFCNCEPPESEESGAAVKKFTRKLHLVASELGEHDATARLEASKGRFFHYAAPEDSSCLVEADEEPPHALNPDALSAGLVVCDLLSTRVVDEMHIMRKNVIDGSNTSGFQRTALLGTGGEVFIRGKRLEIQSVCIEEESAGILKGQDSEATYDLGRLGIPLIEIATAPSISSGEEAREAAETIGALLRKTGMVARGIGTIRQDLNISITGGARVEIKGVQDLSMVQKTVELEAKRQQALLEIAAHLKERLGERQISQTFFDITSVFSENHSPMVSKLLKNGAKVFALALPGFHGLLGQEISPGRRFGSELADYARTRGVRGLIHSDEEMEKYGISEDEISEIKVALSLSEKDGFAIVLADTKKAQEALSEVSKRASVLGVPEETRKANPDGTTSYMRPLPGKARLYPETDLEPITITEGMRLSAKKKAGEIAAREKRKDESMSSVNSELASQLSSLRGLISHNHSFKPLAQTPELSVFLASIDAGVEQKYAASVLTNVLKGLKREGANTQALDEPRLLSVFHAQKSDAFAKAATQEILRFMCEDARANPEAAAKALGLELIKGAALEKIIKEENHTLQSLMAKYRLRVDAGAAAAHFAKKK